jgi:hypothetical protein
VNGGSRLRGLPIGARLGLTGVLATLLLGVWASLRHLENQHQGRDERPGVSMDDLRGAYHGVERKAPLLAALERGHPDDLPAGERDVFLRWLAGGRVSEEYDDPGLGASSPAELLDRRCVSCHSRRAAQTAAPVAGETAESRGDDGAESTGAGPAAIPLEYWDDVERVAFSRSIEPLPGPILDASLHAHALSLGVVTLAVAALLLATRWGNGWKGALSGISGVALLVDLGSWGLARSSEAFVWAIVAGGIAWSAATVVSLSFVFLDLWFPLGPSRDREVPRSRVEPGS